MSSIVLSQLATQEAEREDKHPPIPSQSYWVASGYSSSSQRRERAQNQALLFSLQQCPKWARHFPKPEEDTQPLLGKSYSLISLLQARSWSVIKATYFSFLNSCSSHYERSMDKRGISSKSLGNKTTPSPGTHSIFHLKSSNWFTQLAITLILQMEKMKNSEVKWPLKVP